MEKIPSVELKLFVFPSCFFLYVALLLPSCCFLSLFSPGPLSAFFSDVFIALELQDEAVPEQDRVWLGESERQF